MGKHAGQRIVPTLLLALSVAALGGCGGGPSATSGAASTSAGGDAASDTSRSADATSGGDTATSGALARLPTAASGRNGSAGRGRDIPPIPDIVIPDITVVDAASRSFSKRLGDVASPVKGVTVSGAVCNGDTVVTRAGVNFGDGSGVINRGGSTTINHGDGSGQYNDGKRQIINHGDGSGQYNDGTTQIIVHGDGSGQYNDGTTQIINHGDGTGLVEGAEVPMDPVAKIPPIGKFPKIAALKPLGKECGTLIRLQDRVLFDFDKATLRPEAGPVLDRLAAALKTTTGTLKVNGHTDSMGTDAYNVDLSRRRAEAVSSALAERGVTATIVSRGYGETQPIAQNSLQSKDNPAGRQLNRRVEIVVPGA